LGSGGSIPHCHYYLLLLTPKKEREGKIKRRKLKE
jgi:hypothetical protein